MVEIGNKEQQQLQHNIREELIFPDEKLLTYRRIGLHYRFGLSKAFLQRCYTKKNN
jgi:hypothetical protein